VPDGDSTPAKRAPQSRRGAAARGPAKPGRPTPTKRRSTLAEGDRAPERSGRRGKEIQGENQLEYDTSLQSGGKMEIVVDEKAEHELAELAQLWPGLSAEVRSSILVLCRCLKGKRSPVSETSNEEEQPSQGCS
jgi:hypothetical protein